ncbi:Uncharacterised protein [Serratia ficaria]|nr:Uncharacterised protein [Serratia ficaria]
MNILKIIVSKLLVGASYSIASVTLFFIGYFLFFSGSDYKYLFALLTGVGFVPGYYVFKLGMRFYDGL